MKKIRIFATALLLAFTLSSCESFFDVELDDQAKIEDIFRQKTEVQKYLSHLYSYIPQEEEVVGMHGWTVGRSDEALFSWYQWVYYTQFRTGNYSSATTNFNYWPDYYIGINQCSIFLKYIDLDKEDTPRPASCAPTTTSCCSANTARYSSGATRSPTRRLTPRA